MRERKGGRERPTWEFEVMLSDGDEVRSWRGREGGREEGKEWRERKIDEGI